MRPRARVSFRFFGSTPPLGGGCICIVPGPDKILVVHKLLPSRPGASSEVEPAPVAMVSVASSTLPGMVRPTSAALRCLLLGMSPECHIPGPG